MCWNSKWSAKKQIAKDDFYVYKIVRKTDTTIESFYLCFKYELGHLYGVPKSLEVNYKAECFYIVEGFHSYKNKPTLKTAVINSKPRHVFDVGIIRQGFDIQYFNSNSCVMTCKIPKGTTYYVNEEGEIVSECLIPIEMSLTLQDYNDTRNRKNL
jgi:hypothetical protein